MGASTRHQRMFPEGDSNSRPSVASTECASTSHRLGIFHRPFLPLRLSIVKSMEISNIARVSNPHKGSRWGEGELFLKWNFVIVASVITLPIFRLFWVRPRWRNVGVGP